MKYKISSFIILIIIISVFIFSSCNKEKKADTEASEKSESDSTNIKDNVNVAENSSDSEDININSDILKINTYNESSAPVNYSIADKNTIGILFSTKRPFGGVEIFCTAGGNENQSVSLTLYEFDTDLKTTVELGKPLITQTFENISENSWLMLKFKDKPVGNYLLVIHKGTQYINLLSEAIAPALEDKIISYYNNIIIETGAFRFRVMFNGNNNENYDVEQYFDSPLNLSKTAKN